MSFAWAVKRYWVSVVFPTVTVWSIYADWSHTQEWKKQKTQQGQYSICCLCFISLNRPSLIDDILVKILQCIFLQMSYSKVLTTAFSCPKTIFFLFAPFGGAYVGKMLDDSETERMSRFRDRSALYGRPPPPPGVKEVPSW